MAFYFLKNYIRISSGISNESSLKVRHIIYYFLKIFKLWAEFASDPFFYLKHLLVLQQMDSPGVCFGGESQLILL
jgi:hypothetical protein